MARETTLRDRVDALEHYFERIYHLLTSLESNLQLNVGEIYKTISSADEKTKREICILISHVFQELRPGAQYATIDDLLKAAAEDILDCDIDPVKPPELIH